MVQLSSLAGMAATSCLISSVVASMATSPSSSSCVELVAKLKSTTDSMNLNVNENVIQHLGNHQPFYRIIPTNPDQHQQLELFNRPALSSDEHEYQNARAEFEGGVYECYLKGGEQQLQQAEVEEPYGLSVDSQLPFFRRSSNGDQDQILARYDPLSELKEGRDHLLLVTKDDAESFADLSSRSDSPILDLPELQSLKGKRSSWKDYMNNVLGPSETPRSENGGLFSPLPSKVINLGPEILGKSMKEIHEFLQTLSSNHLETLRLGEEAKSWKFNDEVTLGSLQLARSQIKILSLSETFSILSLSKIALLQIEHVLRIDSKINLLATPEEIKTNLRVQENGNEEPKPKPNPHYSTPRFNPLIHELINSKGFEIEKLRKDVRTLSGEDQRRVLQDGKIGWNSRHSGSFGGRKSGEWLLDEMRSYLSPLHGSSCRFETHTTGFNPNIICEIPAADDDWLSKSSTTLHSLDPTSSSSSSSSSSNGTVIISAHSDSRGSFGETSAPGADDDGSGTTAILAIARALGQRPIRFERPVRLILFTGEEQGLVGSKAYAKKLREAKEDVRFMLQIDMIAYRKAGEPLQMAFPGNLATKSATDLVRKITNLYVPELLVGFTPACCSDHQEESFPATWIFERNGPIADPKYHNSGDLSDRDGYSFEQLQASTQAVFAALLNVAGFYL